MNKNSFGHTIGGGYAVEVQEVKRALLRNKYYIELVYSDESGRHVVESRLVSVKLRDKTIKEFESSAKRYSVEDKAPLFKIAKNGNKEYMIAVKRCRISDLNISSTHIRCSPLKDDSGVEYVIPKLDTKVFCSKYPREEATYISLGNNIFYTENEALSRLNLIENTVKEEINDKKIEFA